MAFNIKFGNIIYYCHFQSELIKLRNNAHFLQAELLPKNVQLVDSVALSNLLTQNLLPVSVPKSLDWFVFQLGFTPPDVFVNDHAHTAWPSSVSHRCSSNIWVQFHGCITLRCHETNYELSDKKEWANHSDGRPTHIVLLTAGNVMLCNNLLKEILHH